MQRGDGKSTKNELIRIYEWVKEKMKNSSSYNPFTDKILSAIVQQIVATADPDKIILFGSRAMDKERKDSDYDICVLKRNAKRKELLHKIYRNLNAGASVDVVLTTPSRYDKLKDKWFLVYSDVEKYGKLVYEK